ncbi:MAG: glutamate--tRNA ligase [Kiritimatiellae bacterium]|nr:glutamate--tRNA ligase [Kiritimatiellia bacterium]
MSVRVRFAPSPTGQVHIGNIRAAIFNWLFARHEGGVFLLRVEDTDRERSTPEAISALMRVMTWLEMQPDEQPVYQSARTARHLAVAEQMVASGAAYREDRDGKGICVVCRMPREGRLEFTDLIKGRIRKSAEDTQDFVIVRADGTPVFHLANVVDDHDMGITHVIRGDDHVENTFKHLQIFRAMGVEPPAYAHLPMIVNAMGKPYSKRDGAAFVGEFQEQGYLPEALFNFLALLGWAPGDDREIMTRAEMAAAFTLDRCKSSAARFDQKKLTWMNGEYLRRLPRATLEAAFRERLAGAGLSPDNLPAGQWEAILDQMIPRTKFFSEVPANCAYFFTEEYGFDPKAYEKRLKVDGVPALLEDVAAAFEALPAFTHESSEAALRALGEARGAGMGALVHPVRVAVSGSGEGPGLFEMLALLGRERVCARLRRVAAALKAGS